MRSILLIYEIKQGKTKTIKEKEKEDLQNLHESANLNQEKDRKRCNFTSDRQIKHRKSLDR